MDKSKTIKIQTADKTLHRKLTIKQHEHHWKSRVNPNAPKE